MLNFLGVESAAVVGLAVPESGTGDNAEIQFLEGMDDDQVEEGQFYAQISKYTRYVMFSLVSFCYNDMNDIRKTRVRFQMAVMGRRWQKCYLWGLMLFVQHSRQQSV